jgi:hypothetical protein
MDQTLEQTLSFFAEMFICLFLLACFALFVEVRHVHERIWTVYDGARGLFYHLSGTEPGCIN